MAKDKVNNILSIVLKILYYLVTILVCLIVFFLLFYIVSSQLHSNDENYKSPISIYTIVSPSMTPVINVYDVVVNAKVNDPSTIVPGDIITYKSAAANSEGMTITHRVIEVSKLPDGTYEYMTQGDNNKEPDSLYVTFDNVIGKEILIIPYIGHIQFLIANQKGWLILLLIPIFIYLIREVFKLIDLFHLRKKVDKVVGTTEENFIEQRRLEKIANEERKEKIRKELEAKEHKIDALQKNPLEPETFLEQYTETIVDIKVNKYKDTIKPTKEIIIDNEEPAPKEEPEKKASIPETPSNIEILATDELSTKIKEYDDKISELNKILKKVEKSEPTESPEDKKSIEEYDSYLQGGKIKVISMVPAKSYKKPDKVNIGYKEEPYIPLNNKRTIAVRPDSEDINNIRNQNKSSRVKQTTNNLNLNPNSIKKVNRPNRKTNTSSSNKNTRRKRQLNLNPKQVKRVSRPNRRKKRPPLIVIEKTSKKK